MVEAAGVKPDPARSSAAVQLTPIELGSDAGVLSALVESESPGMSARIGAEAISDRPID